MGQYKEAVQRGITQLANATYALTRKFNELGLKSARDRLADWFPSVVEVKNHTLGVETTAYSRHQAQNIANFLREEGITANRSDVRIHSFTSEGRRMWNIAIAAEKIDEDKLDRFLARP